MHVLLDGCVWGGAAAALRDAGHEVELAGAWPQDPGDEEILAIAFRHRQILVTHDKDFGELAVVHERPLAGRVTCLCCVSLVTCARGNRWLPPVDARSAPAG